MGDSENRPSQLSFNRFLRVAFQGSRVTSHGGPILVRELDDLGYVWQSREEIEVLSTLLAEQYERGSVMLSSRSGRGFSKT